MEKVAIGIDLGTTYSAVAIYPNGNPEIILNDQGNRTTPSCVAFTSTKRIVGEGANHQAVNNPENTIYGIKRLMGRVISDEAIQEDIRAWPFRVIEEDDRIKIQVKYKDEEKTFLPEEISSYILEKMKNIAEKFLGAKITDAVITCPAYFNNAQKQATIDAAEIAGLKVLRMINEPTAAAMAYGLNVNNTGRKNVLIYDFGGGTFDVSILMIKDQEYKVRATNGDSHLGGEDFDQRMVDYFVKQFKSKYDRDISKDKGLMRSLKSHCEKVKKILSVDTKAEFLMEGTNLKGVISRACFEDMNDDLFEKTIKLVDATLKDANMTIKEIDDVVLVGGSSRIPKIQEMLSEYFEGKVLSHKINPDEAVALGAAIQAGMLQEQVVDQLKGLKLIDVCPLSLSTRILDGSSSVIIKRNTPIPCELSDEFGTVFDYQTSVCFKIYEGERFMAADNYFVGEFRIEGFPSKLRGEVPIKLTYEIDDNGILTASAIDAITGIQNRITITNKSRLSKDEAKRLAAEAAKFREEDAMHEIRLASYNAFERSLYEIKRKMYGMSDDVNGKKAAKIFIEDLSKWLLENPLATKEEFEQRKNDLEEFWDHLLKQM